ncbi:hypothetical protein DPMN_016749 [Dreissena polymorpha]|uniref:Uncharacterized protein n=1 Tax=Dreissena polymorpha TaxID=45954 RepID=A0A9D4NDM9_DREPO|nr:hypothetical protein DPMN_016749 [Dreissena polymorpha]
MIIDCKATVRRRYCNFCTSFVRLLRPQNDYGVLTARLHCVLRRLLQTYYDYGVSIATPARL